MRLQDIETIIQLSRRQYLKTKEHIFLLKIYKVIVETNDNKIKESRELCDKRQRRNKDARNIAIVV